MWIQIQHNAEQCTCRFDVASEEIAAHINEAASTLEARLEGISFKQVKVSGSVWDGDHMKAVAALVPAVLRIGCDGMSTNENDHSRKKSCSPAIRYGVRVRAKDDRQRFRLYCRADSSIGERQ